MQILNPRSIATCVIAATLVSGIAMADDFQPGPALLFEMMGTGDCETIPADLPVDQMRSGIEAMQADGQPLLQAEFEGFFAGTRHGFSLYGSRQSDAGFGAIHSIWGELEDHGLVTLCVLTLQLGNTPVEAGRFQVADFAQLDDAEPGQVVALGVVMELASTGEQSEEGRDIYRQRIIGEATFASGHFELKEWSQEGFSGAMQLSGEVSLEESDQAQAVSLEAQFHGMHGMQSVPDISLDD
jgi:hypothetical protein